MAVNSPVLSTPRLFINYRTADTGHAASRLYSDLCRRFRQDQIFIDHGRLLPGEDWPQRLRLGVARSDVMFILIGPRWFKSWDLQSGDRLLNLPDDWVRREIEIALLAGTQLIPILVDGTSPPTERDLQTVPTISALAERHALDLRGKEWDRDLQRIAELLDAAGFQPAEPSISPDKPAGVEHTTMQAAPIATLAFGLSTSVITAVLAYSLPSSLFLATDSNIVTKATLAIVVLILAAVTIHSTTKFNRYYSLPDPQLRIALGEDLSRLARGRYRELYQHYLGETLSRLQQWVGDRGSFSPQLLSVCIAVELYLCVGFFFSSWILGSDARIGNLSILPMKCRSTPSCNS